MHVQTAVSRVESALQTQLQLGGADPAVENAAQLLQAVLEPAIRQAAMELAQQAAEEVAAQLPDRRVDLVVVDGDPTLLVSADVGGQVSATDDEYEARITLRLPQSLKSLVEQAADTSDESINSWVVKALASRARARSGGQHFTGVIEL